MNRLYFCLSCGKIVLVKTFTDNILDKLTEFLPKLELYLNGKGLKAEYLREDLYEIKDKIPYILSGSILPEEFCYRNSGKSVLDEQISDLEIVAIRYTYTIGMSIFHLKR